jgi:23S rRNA U2552 (ribose-2'-O)-methylase RlmE/FtsJ
MNNDFTFTIKRICLDENYHPSVNTRITTNFANLARGDYRQSNLRNALNMINHRFNALAHWDNPTANRYCVELEIISVDIDIENTGQHFPSIEILKANIFDNHTKKRIQGIVGNNFSSYVRDYDFSVLLQEHNKGQSKFSLPENFGVLHGKLFQAFVNSDAYKQNFKKPPVICLSVSDNKTYTRTENNHPVLGVEYQPNESSLTEQYFKNMGLAVRYFMPPNSAAPLAFYFFGDLLNDYTPLELISTISTMETFQKIYRPEIYNANSTAGKFYKPDLQNLDHSLTHIIYDREERSQLASEQGKFAQANFITPYKATLEQWVKHYV